MEELPRRHTETDTEKRTFRRFPRFPDEMIGPTFQNYTFYPSNLTLFLRIGLDFYLKKKIFFEVDE